MNPSPSSPIRQRRRSLLLLALLILSPAAMRFAEEPEVIRLGTPPEAGKASPAPAPVRPAPPEMTQEALAELWARRQALLEKGDVAGAERQVQTMREVVRREGTLGADDLAGVFLADGYRALDAGQGPRALQSFHLAKEFAPDRPGAYFAVARTLWSIERNASGAAGAMLSGIRVTLANPVSRSARGGSLVVVLLAGSLVAALLWCVITAFRTFRLVHHDLTEGRARRLARPAAALAAWAIYLLPALLWLTGVWILVYWLVLGMAYLRRGERAVSIAACAILVAALPLLGWVTRESAVNTDPTVQILLETARGGYDPDRVPALEKLVAANPEQPVYRFLLARTYQAGGSLEASLQEYREIQHTHPRDARAWINSGNLFFGRQQYAQAATEYRRALEADPSSAAAHFNLSLALQATLHLEEADAAFRKARELDNNLITTVLAAGSDTGDREPIDARVSGEEILRLRQEHPGRTGAAGWRRDGVNLLGAAGLAGLLGGIFAWSGPRWGLGTAQKCGKCGRTFCRRCQVGMRREEGFCTPCRHLYVLKDPVPAAARAERERLVAAHDRWQWMARRLVSLVLPGAGHIQGGRTGLGLVVLWVTCVGAASLALSGRLLAFPGITGTASGPVRAVAASVVAAAWLAGNALAFEARKRKG